MPARPDATPSPLSSPQALLSELHVTYADALDAAALDALLHDANVLAVIGFGDAAPATHADPRYLRVNLQPVDASAPYEIWRVSGAVRGQRERDIAWSSDGDYSFGALEVDEAAHGGIEAAAEYAYRRLVAAITTSRTPHALRIWNYLDAINLGDGDDERYRRFCVGRATGLEAHGFVDTYPAATGIGVRDGRRVLQVYWLASRVAGAAFENPRQVSAWRYPRQYGIKAPAFARALRAPTAPAQVYLSGTAAIVGHRSHHHDDVVAQLDETLRNLSSLLDIAGIASEQRFGPRCLLKGYLRQGEDAALARARLIETLPAHTPVLWLQGDVCRRELLIEIDGVQTG